MAAQMSGHERERRRRVRKEFREALRAVAGLAPTHVQIGTAWHFSIDWGEPNQTGAAVPPASSHRLLVSGSWRLDAQDRVICSWRNPGSRADSKLPSLVGRPVVAIRVAPPGNDLTISFEGGRTLRIFCDRDSAYIFFTQGYAFGIDEKCDLEIAR